MRLVNHFMTKSIMLIIPILLTSLPCSAEIQGDKELLKTVALANKANFESILTWRSDVYEEQKATEGDSYKRTLNSQCIMVYDQLKQAVRWNKTPKEYLLEEDGKRKNYDMDNSTDYTSSMFINSTYYNYVSNRQPGDPNDKFYILTIDDAKKAQGLLNYTFDPRLLITLNGEPVYNSLMFFYEHAKDVNNISVSRSGDIVTLEYLDNKLDDKRVFDLSKGGNLVEWYNKGTAENDRKCTYENKSGVWVLKTYYKTYSGQAQRGIDLETRLLKFDNSVVNVPFKDDEFTVAKMGIKNGEMIQDHISGKIYKYDGTFQEPLRFPKQLAGKKLPILTNLGINISVTDVNDKKILLCFFDYEQRPSRNCIDQLSKSAQELKIKDIEIIAVHASKIEKAKLNEWIRENNISFPVGMIEMEEEQTKFNWGVKALPWLILTDKNHIVKAEGFSINELDEKIKTMESER